MHHERIIKFMKKRITRYVPIARENIKSDNPFGGTYISGGMVDNERTNLYIMETIKDMFNKMQDEDLSGDIMRIRMEPLPHDDYIKVEVEF